MPSQGGVAANFVQPCYGHKIALVQLVFVEEKGQGGGQELHGLTPLDFP